MHVKLIILFRCDTFDDPEDMLVINVQHGQAVIIKLRGYRDPPILRGKFNAQKMYKSDWNTIVSI